MKVNIYLETDKQNQECTWRKYGYVLEAMAGRCIPVTRLLKEKVKKLLINAGMEEITE